jgi:transcriptional regulator with XRE-family HTH domain
MMKRSVSLSPYERRGRSEMSRRVLRGFSAERFVAARRRSGLSVSDLSRLARVGTSTVHAWEAGRATPQIDLLARIMQILGTPISEVVTVDPDERYPGDLRVIKGLTQPQLAAAARIATTTLRGIERADLALTDTNAATLARLLGIGVDEYRAAYQRARERPPGVSV